MSAHTPTSTTRHLLRQRSPLVLATLSGAIGLYLLVSLVRQWSDDPQPVFIAWVLFGLAVVWSVFVRPAVLVADEGVTIRNVLRDVHIPWSRVTDVECRWNLKVFVGERGYSAWAISSQAERPKRASAGMVGGLLPGRLDQYASPGSRLSAPVARVTAGLVARSIDQAKEDYDEAVAGGELPADPDAVVRVVWAPLALAMITVPAIAVVALSLT